MAIQKFIVNGDEAKIDYEGLENKPFGEEELITIFPEVIDYPFYYNEQANIYYSSVKPAIPLVLVVNEEYIVTFDEIEYTCVCHASSGSRRELGDSNFLQYPFHIYLRDVEGYEFVIDTSLTGSAHTFKIEQRRPAPLSAEYLPKELQYAKHFIFAEETIVHFTPEGNGQDSSSNPGTVVPLP